MIKTAQIILACFGVILIISCGGKKKETTVTTSQQPGAGGGRGAPSRVDVYVVERETVTEKIEVPGTIVANESTEIHPEIAGRITSLNVREGQTVGKGTVLARLYDGDLQAQLNKLRVQLQIANQREARMEQLVKIGGISKQDLDLARLEVSNIRSDMAILQADIAKTIIRAPFSGMIGLKNVSPGAYVTPATVITTIQKVAQLKLDFAIPEKYADQMRVGRIVNFTYQGSTKSYGARIMATESSVAEATRSLMIRSIIMNPDKGLLPGAFATVTLELDPNTNAILVPSQAILPAARSKKVIVYNNGNADFRDITTGLRDSSRVQVLSGLKVGDTVVVTGLLTVRPDSKIQLGRIINAAPRAALN